MFNSICHVSEQMFYIKMYFAACLYCVLCVLAWRLCLCGGKRTS